MTRINQMLDAQQNPCHTKTITYTMLCHVKNELLEIAPQRAVVVGVIDHFRLRFVVTLRQQLQYD